MPYQATFRVKMEIAEVIRILDDAVITGSFTGERLDYYEIHA